MKFTEIIEKVNSDKRLIPDLLKTEKGNNFRAVSESAILDVIDPVLKEAGWFYTVEVKKSDLQIRESFGSKGKKLQFIATVEIRIEFIQIETEINFSNLSPIYTPHKVTTEAVGMGIDDNDKAMGKAYTYALKYALLKVFRLRFGDDSDYKASEPLLIDRPKEEKETPKATKKSSDNKETPMSEKQRDYILGMMEDKGVTSQIIMGKFGGCDPVEDEYIPMKTARAIIKWLEEQEKLPF